MIPCLSGSRGDLKLTPKAQGLEQELPKVLSQLASTLQGDDFKPSDLSGTFRIALHSYLSESHGYALFQALTKEAPELDIEIHNYSSATVSQLINQELDAGIKLLPNRCTQGTQANPNR